MNIELYQDILATNLYPNIRIEIESLLSGDMYTRTELKVPVQYHDVCNICASHACQGCIEAVSNSCSYKLAVILIVIIPAVLGSII